MSRGVRDAVTQAAARRRRRTLVERWRAFAIVAAAVFALDQILKIAVRASLEPGERVDVFPGFAFARFRNEGIAFGLFPGRQAVVAVLTVVALCGIAIAIVGLMRRHRGVATGGGLLVGGSLGNLVDRVLHGGVTDFLDPSVGPAFNVADIAITCGAALIAIGLFISERDADEGDTVGEAPWTAR